MLEKKLAIKENTIVIIAFGAIRSENERNLFLNALKNTKGK